MDALSKRRKSRPLLPIPSSPATPTRKSVAPAVAPLETNNDEAEREQRRARRVEEERRRKSLFSPSKRPGLSDVQLSELYASAIRLATENKINQKNSWSLKLIDYMNDLLKTQTVAGGDMTNFQAASCTLEASAKIYSCRVDAVHGETYALLGGLSRSDGRHDESESTKENSKRGNTRDREEGPVEEGVGDEGEEGYEDGGSSKQRGRKRGVVSGGATLENNLDTITLRKFDLGSLIDPLFFKTSRMLDEGGANGMLLNQLRVHKGCSLLFDSNDTAFGGEMTFKRPPDPVSLDISDLWSGVLPSASTLTHLEVCPAFTEFKKWKESGSVGLWTNTSVGEEYDHAEDCGVEDDEWPADLDGEELPPLPVEGMQPDLPTTNGMVNLEVAVAALSTVADEYSFFDRRVLANWAGPAHWKFHTTVRSESEGKRMAERDRRGREAKSALSIDFLHLPEIDFPTALEESTRTKNTLAIEKWSEAAVTLPSDLRFSVQSLTQLFTKPKATMTYRGQPPPSPPTTTEEGSDEWYDYQNSNDVEGFCPGSGDVDDGDDCATEGTIPLVPEPLKTERVPIKFATTAKRVNVREVKASLWSALHTPPSQKRDEGDERSFQDILTQLPQHHKKGDLTNVSVPMAFICLLHLANEKGLHIEGQTDMKDVKVVPVTSV